MRLALELGWFNYEAMLQSGEPKHLERWKEFHSEEPFGKPWHQMSAGSAAIVNEIRIIAAGLGGVKLKDKDFVKEDGFVPQFVEPETKPDAKAGFNLMRSRIGT